MHVVALNRFFCPDHSAASQILTDLARHLVAAGHEVTVVTSRQLYDDAGARLAARETIDGIRVRRVWTTRLGRHWLPGRALDYATFYVTALFAVWRLARRDDVVLAKTDPPLLSVFAAWAARRRGARLVTWQQDLFPELAAALGMRWAEGPIGRGLVALRNGSLRAAARTVVCDDRMAERLAEIGISRGVRVVPNWSDDEIRPIPKSVNPLRRSWRLEDRFVVGYSGNLGRAHQAERVAELVARTHDVADLTWVFIGGGCGLARVRERAEALPTSAVAFRPYQPRARLSASLSLPDLHLVSLDPKCEGLVMPSKLYGILAAGRAIVFLGDTDGSVAREIRAHGLGLVLAADRPETWRPALAELRAAPDTLEAMGARARRRFESAYRPERALARWEEVLTGDDRTTARGEVLVPAT